MHDGAVFLGAFCREAERFLAFRYLVPQRAQASCEASTTGARAKGSLSSASLNWATVGALAPYVDALFVSPRLGRSTQDVPSGNRPFRRLCSCMYEVCPAGTSPRRPRSLETAVLPHMVHGTSCVNVLRILYLYIHASALSSGPAAAAPLPGRFQVLTWPVALSSADTRGRACPVNSPDLQLVIMASSVNSSQLAG